MLITLYPWIKAFHIISMVAWMAGMFYLPRLFVYHCDTKPGSTDSERFKVMEYRLNLVGLSGPITMGYMHGPAGPGENAQQIAPINIPIYDNTIWDGVTLTEEQAADVLAGRWYVNVMTIQYPDGEIRGQILPLKK